MTRDDIIRMAREAGHAETDSRGRETFIFDEYNLEYLAALVAAAEREACAKDLDELSEAAKDLYAKGFVWQAINKSAAAIRARGQA